MFRLTYGIALVKEKHNGGKENVQIKGEEGIGKR